jgi:hypothetical protein
VRYSGEIAVVVFGAALVWIAGYATGHKRGAALAATEASAPEAPAPCADSATAVSYTAACRPDQRGEVVHFGGRIVLLCRCPGEAP